MNATPAHPARRGVTLIEAVVVVVVLSLAMPPMLSVVNAVAEARAEAATISSATALAQGVMEQVLADVHGGEDAPGYEAMEDATTYLEEPDSGLYTRLEWIAEPYAARGITFEVQIGAPVGPEGVATGDADADRFRSVTVVVEMPGSQGRFEMRISSLVGDLS